ncbi:hypothetical protein [Actinomadura yumaensis]|uniref:DUF222 domain-containing protein n=1 Tax=Actinomadura yumaensis TaxID=111807 RepID=A0ABW2CSA1_9ACTN
MNTARPRAEADDLVGDLTRNLLDRLQQEGITGADITTDALTDALRQAVADPAGGVAELDPQLEHVWGIAARTRGRAEQDLTAIRELRATFAAEAAAERRHTGRDRRAGARVKDQVQKAARLLGEARRRAERFTLPAKGDLSRYQSATVSQGDETTVHEFVSAIVGNVTTNLAIDGIDVTPAQVTRALHAALTGASAARPEEYDAEIEHILMFTESDPVTAAERMADVYELRKELMEQADLERVLHIQVLLRRGMRPASILRILPGLERSQYDRMQNRLPADVAVGDFTGAFINPAVVDTRDLADWRVDAKAAQARFLALDEDFQRAVRARQHLVWTRYNDPTHPDDTDNKIGHPSDRDLAAQYRMAYTTANWTRKLPARPEIYKTAA